MSRGDGVATAGLTVPAGGAPAAGARSQPLARTAGFGFTLLLGLVLAVLAAARIVPRMMCCRPRSQLDTAAAAESFELDEDHLNSSDEEL